jgi:multisubunit Na+/H+ antiporter MnhE subunit
MPARRQRGGPVFRAVHFAVLLGAWFLFVGKIGWNELIAGTAGSAVAATAAQIVWAQHVAAFRDHAGWVLEMWRLPKYMITGSWEIFAVLLRQLFGGKPAESLLLAVPYEAVGDDDASAARRALAIAYTTSTPNFVVVAASLTGGPRRATDEGGAAKPAERGSGARTRDAGAVSPQAAVRGAGAALWDPPMRLLREAHTGRVGDYVAWLAFGTAAFGGLCAALFR